MSWAQRMKTMYTLGFLTVLLIIFSIIASVFLIKKPTCFDGKQNGGETGIDCGGSCQMLCRAEYANPVVLWGPRWSKVTNSGNYNFLTYAQNPNIGAGAYNVPYSFKVYDKNDVLLYQKTGKTYIPPNNNFVIFDDNINLNDKVPVRTKFEFLSGFAWVKITNLEAGITAVSKNLINEDTQPKLLVTLKNTTLKPIPNIESIAILYDENNNAIAFSKTKIDVLDSDGSTDIVFTWPEKFKSKIFKIDIVSRVLPQ